MFSQLKDGDLVFAGSDQLKFKNNKLTIHYPSIEHGMIFNMMKLYHSSKGEYYSGVRSHDFKKLVPEEGALGNLSVVRCNIPALRLSVVNILKRWDPVQFIEKSKKNKNKNQIFPITLPIPFDDFNSRKVDDENDAKYFELYRAILAYQRNHDIPVQPLSKKKGVSCGNYISYSYKAAIVDYLFPNGLSHDLINQMKKISSLKYTDDKKKKISDLDIKHFHELTDIFLQELKNINVQEKESLFKFLQLNTKGRTVNYFIEEIVNMPDIFEIKGVIFYKKVEQQLIPYVLNLEALLKLVQNNNEENDTPSLILPDEVLKQFKEEQEIENNINLNMICNNK